MIQPKYNIGDTVWSGLSGWMETFIKCPDCLGEKLWQVTTPTGEQFEVPCNTCMRGYFCTGEIGIYSDAPIVQCLTVGSVRIDTADENPISYMCKETGVGSGQVHYEKNLFSSKDDATSHAKELSAIATVQRNKDREADILNKKKKVVYCGTREEREIRVLKKKVEWLTKKLAQPKNGLAGLSV